MLLSPRHFRLRIGQEAAVGTSGEDTWESMFAAAVIILVFVWHLLVPGDEGVEHGDVIRVRPSCPEQPRPVCVDVLVAVLVVHVHVLVVMPEVLHIHAAGDDDGFVRKTQHVPEVNEPRTGVVQGQQVHQKPKLGQVAVGQVLWLDLENYRVLFLTR